MTKQKKRRPTGLGISMSDEQRERFIRENEESLTQQPLACLVLTRDASDPDKIKMLERKEWSDSKVFLGRPDESRKSSYVASLLIWDRMGGTTNDRSFVFHDPTTGLTPNIRETTLANIRGLTTKQYDALSGNQALLKSTARGIFFKKKEFASSESIDLVDPMIVEAVVTSSPESDDEGELRREIGDLRSMIQELSQKLSSQEERICSRLEQVVRLFVKRRSRKGGETSRKLTKESAIMQRPVDFYISDLAEGPRARVLYLTGPWLDQHSRCEAMAVHKWYIMEKNSAKPGVFAGQIQMMNRTAQKFENSAYAQRERINRETERQGWEERQADNKSNGHAPAQIRSMEEINLLV